MSVFEPRTLTCPHCGAVSEQNVAISLNGDRSSEERQAILDGRFQVFQCAACGVPSTADGPLMYVDFERRHFIGCYPRTWETAWRSLENEPMATWRRTIVEHAPASMRKISHGFVVRAVFGLPMLREKLLCLDHGIDDRMLETLKFDLMRTNTLPMHAMARPILDHIDDDDMHLEFGAQEPADNAGASERAALGLSAEEDPAWQPIRFRIPRSRIDALADARGDWGAFLRELSAGPYVDVGRLVIPGTSVRPG
jgi:hypothetical protein